MNGKQSELAEGMAPPEKKPRVFQWQLDALYDDYPRHEGRAGAENAARTLLKSRKIGFDELLRRVRAYAAYVDREQIQYVFIPLPATWFRGRWKDDVKEMGSRQAAKPTIQPGQPSRKEQAAVEEQRKRIQHAAWWWWIKKVPEPQKQELRKRHPPSAAEYEVVIAEFDRANRPGYEEKP